MNEEWSVSPLYLGIIASFLQIGILCGNILWGIISDKKGRKLPYRVSGFIGLIASVCLVLSQNAYMVSVSLFCLGFSMAGDLSLSGTVFCEFCPPTKRYLLTMLSLFLSFGAISTSVIALVVVYFNNTGIENWRVIAGSICIVALLNFILRFNIQETPAYLYGNKNTIEAEKVLNVISLRNFKKEFMFKDLNSVLTQYNKAETSCNSVLTELPEDPPFAMIFKQIFGRKLLSTTIKLSLVSSN